MQLGTNLEDNSIFELDLSTLLRTHTFIQGMTGSTKTNLILRLVELVKEERPEVQMIFLDDQEEYTELPRYFKDFKLISKENTPKIFDLKYANQIGIQTRRLERSVVVKLDDFEDHGDRETFVAEFIKGFSSLGKEVGTPSILFIDEADQYCPTKSNRSNIPSRYPIINMLKRARKQNISIVLATQFLSEVEIRARRECANRICGKTTELRDRRIVSELLANPKIADELFDLRKGEFYVRGEIFQKGISKIHVEETKISKKVAGVAEIPTLREVHEKTKDKIFEDAVENKNNQSLVDLLQQKIGDLEKKLAEAKQFAKEQYIEGYNDCEKEWQEKSAFKRLLK